MPTFWIEPMQSEDQASVEESSQPSPLTGGSFSSVLSAGDYPVGERERTFQENGRGKGLSEKQKGEHRLRLVYLRPGYRI
jgi:hypothetical protein